MTTKPDNAIRDRWLACEANALWEKLRFFPPTDQMFVLSELAMMVTRKLKSRESTRHHVVDFTRDEAPTDPIVPAIAPLPEIGDRATRAIRLDDLDALRKKSKE